MRKWYLNLVLTLVAVLAMGAPAGAQQNSPEEGLSGQMSLSVHSHSSQFTDTLFQTNPLDYPATEGDQFSYSSIPCSRPAPFNDRSLEFNPDYPGIEDPASTRHFVEGTITSVDENGRTGTIEGTITTILCVDGQESEHTITTAFEGRFVETPNGLRIVGTYEIVDGTGVFEDLEGDGRITGTITCLPSTLERQAAESCAELGVYSDAVFQLHGSFEDPTVPSG